MSTDNDIVTDLRQRHANVTGIDTRITTPIVGQTIFSQAADEIDRLREQLRLANIDNFNTAAEVERLRAERDEARQRVCSIAYQEQHIQKLVKTINTLLIERDEARRYACDNNPFRLTKWQLAKIKGWDCFDLENGNA